MSRTRRHIKHGRNEGITEPSILDGLNINSILNLINSIDLKDLANSIDSNAINEKDESADIMKAIQTLIRADRAELFQTIIKLYAISKKTSKHTTPQKE